MKREKQKDFGLYVIICIVMLGVTSISCGYANQKTDKQFEVKNDSLNE